MVDLVLPALPIDQRGVFYVVTISAGDLVDNYKVDRWHRTSNPDGYQRNEFEDKIEEFKHYLLSPELVKAGVSLIDQTILVNVRGKVSYNVGKLYVSGDMYVVDGQHRTGGLKIACSDDPLLRSLQVPIVILNVDKTTERARFLIINEKAKRVPTDLAGRQLVKVHPEIMRLVKHRFEPDLVIWALPIIDRLNVSSPIWKDAIVVRGAE